MIIDDLRGCKSETEINTVFEKYNIVDIKDKIKHLKEAVFNPICSRQDLDLETELAIWIEVLLMGDWKLNYLYQKLGF